MKVCIQSCNFWLSAYKTGIMFFVLLEPKKRRNVNIPCFGKDLPEEVDGSAGKERCLWTEIPNSPFPCKIFHRTLAMNWKERIKTTSYKFYILHDKQPLVHHFSLYKPQNLSSIGWGKLFHLSRKLDHKHHCSLQSNLKWTLINSALHFEQQFCYIWISKIIRKNPEESWRKDWETNEFDSEKYDR